MILLCIIYLLNLYLEKKYNERQDNIYKYVNIIIQFLFYIIIGLSLFGFLFNLYILRRKLGKKFSLLLFIYGSRDQECFSKEIFNKFEKFGILTDVKSTLINKENLKNKLPNKLQKKLYN